MHCLLSLLHRFRSDERGAFLAIFGVIGVVLIAMSGAVVDYVSIEQSRTRAQVALDAAVLALQAEIYNTSTTAEALRLKAEALLIERLDERPNKQAGDPSIWKVCNSDADKPCAKVTAATIDKVNSKLTLTATMNIPLYFVALVGVDHMRVGLLSEATRGSMNVEVAVALDTTGSMSGQRIKDLREATKQLITAVVQDQQTPTYSKVALVPYSMGVNMGSYAEAARGTIRQSTPITNVAWASSAATITNVTKAYPPVVTTALAHGFATGDRVYIYNTVLATSVTNQEYTITRVSNTKFSLNGINGTPSSFTVPLVGVAARCVTTTCELVVTSTNHGIPTDKYVYIDGLTGVDPNLNSGAGSIKQQTNPYLQVTALTADSYALKNRKGYLYGAYLLGGNSWCTDYGCQIYRFINAENNINVWSPSTCVAERTGAQAYTDAATGTNPVMINYPPNSNSGNGCVDEKIQPLTSDKTVLNALAESLSASGSTAAQIGIAWAWYAVSPNVGAIFPAASRPAAYTAPKTRKIVIIMTDGEFNSPYCAGVIAKNAGTGSGGANNHINCDATNGDAYDQAQKLCDGMKQAGITVYTVGFDIADLPKAKAIMANCATDSTKAYNASNGDALKAAFKEIGDSIAALRISK